MNFKVLQDVSKVVELDLILCLGKNLNKDNSLDWVLQARVEKAIETYNDHPEAVLMFSGGKYFLASDYSSSEADAMLAYVKKQHKDLADKVIVESESDNTIDQLCRIKNEFILPKKWRSIALVSDEFHVRRAGVFMDGILGDGYKLYFVGAKGNLTGNPRRALEELEDKFLEMSIKTVKSLPRGDENAYLKHNIKHKKQRMESVERGKSVIDAVKEKAV